MARKRYQTGRVFLRGKEPKWTGRWREDVVMADGSIVRIERSAVLGTKNDLPTAKLAQRRLDMILARINAPDYRPGRMATVAEFAERWESLFLAQRKPATRLAAKSHLKNHILPVLGKLGLDCIGRETQQGFVSYLCGRVSRKSAVNILGTLSSMLSTARGWGYTAETVSLKTLALPDPLHTEARCFTVEETAKIMAEARYPLRAMVALAAMTGMRAGEIMGLQVTDVDFARRVINVRRSAWHGRLQAPKSRAAEAALPMPEPLESILREYLSCAWRPNAAGMLFCNRFGRVYTADRVVTKHLRPLLSRLEIPGGGFHAFRHLHTSLLLEAGASPKVAQAQLRHSDPRVTLGVYSHLIGESHRQAVERVAELLRPDAPKSEGSAQLIQ